ncbi:GTP-binding protein [Entomomonas moraniae]|uniref:Ancillary SecYEG translocon subunit n=1 Tax=Entomomonas moraniae TaxID=2213226 RepID=A0A3Q9JIH6_9GAMM|nr:tetratricopeptide repeat protein [Entomomonas moraniae]AZS50330.1 GTP-binding protein [Entomomonas moraniae]
MTTRIENEEIEELKSFWNSYGKPIFIGVLLAIAIVSVWKFWENHQIANKVKEAQNYQLLIFAMSQPLDKVNEADVISIADQLQKANPDSYYAQYAKFYLAKLAVSQNKLDDAAKALKAVLDKPADAALGELSRERLVRVLLAQNKLDEAFALLQAPVEKEFVTTREELKGDVLLKQSKIDQAREAYRAALAAAEADKLGNQLIIKLKLNNLAQEDIK